MDRTEFEEMLREAIGDIAPHFTIEENDEGELVVLTGLAEDVDSEELIPYDSEDNEDFDPNTVHLEDED
jgi:hypothetical protein